MKIIRSHKLNNDTLNIQLEILKERESFERLLGYALIEIKKHPIYIKNKNMRNDESLLHEIQKDISE